MALALVMLPAVVVAQDNNTNDEAKKQFCKYTMETAAAQRDLLRTPSAIIGPIEPSTGTAPQMVVGITESVGGLRAAGLTMKVATATCNLYDVSSEAQRRIYFALPSIEKLVLEKRLTLIRDATNQLDVLIAKNHKMVDTGNLTKSAVYALETAKVRLDLNRTAALTGIATPYIPPMSDTPLRDLLRDKAAADADNQKAIARLEKQQTWDIKLGGGYHEQITQVGPIAVVPGQSTHGAYGEFSFTYNFGRKAIDRHLDKATIAYSAWKQSQFDDIQQQASVLKKEIENTTIMLSSQLDVLLAHDAEIQQGLTSLEGVDTSNVIAFRNQLLADQLVLRVDVQDLRYRLLVLNSYLQDNF